MSLEIPQDTVAKILELRTKNGLAATPEALEADLLAAKCKWTLEAAPRYRQAGHSPIYVSGKYLTASGACPATGEKEAGNGTPKAVVKKAKYDAAAAPQVADEGVFYRVLHGKGFKV